jgi:hypothetical protein
MKYIPLVLLAAALPVAAQMSDPSQPASQPADGSQPADASSTPSSNAADAAPAPIGPPLTNAPGLANPADSEPVVQAQPLDQATAAVAAKSAEASAAPAANPANGASSALSPDPFSDPLIAQIVVRYQKAWDGDRKETKALTADLERWMKDEPNNYLLMAYLGSAYALDSRDSWIGPGKLSFLKKGSKALDDAVAGDPSNPAIRLLRAMNYYELPAIFGKHRAAHDDFNYLLQQLSGALPMSFALSNDTRQAIYYYAGLSDVQFSDTSGARDAWQRGLAIAPQSALGVKTQAELSKLK